MPKTSLLLDEYPLILIPSLALALGDRDALFLQQIHYWIVHNQRRGSARHYHAGRWWTYNTIGQWQQQFPFWSESTIKRIIARNQERGTLIIGNYNLAGYDRTNWYTLDYDRINDLIDALERRQAQTPPTTDLMDQLKLIDDDDDVPATQAIPTHTDPALWGRCLDELRLIVTRSTYDRLLAHLILSHPRPHESGESEDPNAYTLHCPPTLLPDAQRNLTLIHDTLTAILGHDCTLTCAHHTPEPTSSPF